MTQANRRMIHLINFPVSKSVNSGWRHPGGNLIPQENIPIKIKPPANRKIKEVRLASSELKILHQKQGDWIEVLVPVLQDHEIVIFEWE